MYVANDFYDIKYKISFIIMNMISYNTFNSLLKNGHYNHA